LEARKITGVTNSIKSEATGVKIKTLLKKCPCCKTGTLITIEVFGKLGPQRNIYWKNKLFLLGELRVRERLCRQEQKTPKTHLKNCFRKALKKTKCLLLPYRQQLFCNKSILIFYCPVY
jgi:hypothetical protein